MDGEAPLHQALDHWPARRLDRHADFPSLARRERQQPGRHLRQPCTAVLKLPFPNHLPSDVEHARLMFLRPPVDTCKPCQLHIVPPVCRIERARQRRLPVPVLALNGANSPRGIHRWRTAGAQVLLRCSMAQGPIGDSRRPTRLRECNRAKSLRKVQGPTPDSFPRCVPG